MTIWAIWKSRNKNSINNQDVASNETREVQKDPFRCSVEKLERNAFHGRLTRQRKLRALWADYRFANFDYKTGPTFDVSGQDVVGLTGVGFLVGGKGGNEYAR